MSTSDGQDRSSSSSRYGRGWVGGDDGDDHQSSPDPGDTYGGPTTPDPTTPDPTTPDPTTPEDTYAQGPAEPEPHHEPEPGVYADPETESGSEGYGPDDPAYPKPDPDPQPEPGGDYDQTKQPPVPPPSKPPTHPCPPSMTCDTKRIDDLECEGKALKAESDAYSKDAEALKTRREAFEKARTAYTTERGKVDARHKGLKEDIDKLVEKAECALNKDERERIDKAFDQVLDCLKECPEDVGCCVDCGFVSQRWTVDQMDGLLARVLKVEKCYDDLVKEPEQLAKRLETLEQEFKELDESKLEAKRTYAMAKRLAWLFGSIWGRFPDASKYHDCLCRGLQCSLRGRKLLAELAGQKAYQECREATRIARCEGLRKNIVEETLATYDVLSPAPNAGGYTGQGAGQAAHAATGAAGA